MKQAQFVAWVRVEQDGATFTRVWFKVRIHLAPGFAKRLAQADHSSIQHGQPTALRFA
jgi:hypothetical protein